ncbi:acetyl-CoA carboxylase biotin carboxylase subunit family protein [Flavobacterium tructae]|uniref:ATP-grasp domain-containing protein n=1 Tax=Flavobacterium tructae TaxID=1114873 RepID=UPI0035A8472C
MKDSILIFGAGELQISIIQKVKDIGFQAIVIDPNKTAPAKTVADVFIQIAGDDFEQTLNVALQNNIKGVLTAATDHPILMMCRIAEVMKLNFPSYSSCETLLDKGKFKIFLNDNNFRHAKGKVFESIDDFDESSYSFPLIIKPVKNSGSRGVIKCESSSQFKLAVEESLQYCKDGHFIIEEFIEGDEISVEAIVYENIVHIIQITDKIITNPPYNVELGHSQPSKYSYKEDEIREILQKIVSLTKFNNSAIHPEFKINSLGEICIIEMGTRLGGDYITSDLTTLSTGVDIELLQILIATGQKINYKKMDLSSAISFFNFPEGTIINNYIDEKELLSRFPEIFRVNSNLKPNQKVKKITNSLERYGYLILQSNSLNKIIQSQTEIINFLHSKYLSND